MAAAEILHELGAFVTVNDSKPFDESPDAQGLLQKGITVICGRHPEDLLDEGFELVVKIQVYLIAIELWLMPLVERFQSGQRLN